MKLRQARKIVRDHRTENPWKFATQRRAFRRYIKWLHKLWAY